MAAAQIPMMRELKGIPRKSYKCRRLCCSPNPYDEGTESCPFGRVPCGTKWAAAQIPMMRELKVIRFKKRTKASRGCSPNPYDEGTES